MLPSFQGVSPSSTHLSLPLPVAVSFPCLHRHSTSCPGLCHFPSNFCCVPPFLSPFTLFYPPCMTHHPCENATFLCCLIFLLHLFTSMTSPSLLIAATPKWDAPLKREEAGTFYCECLSKRRPSRKHLYNIIVRYAIQKDDDNWRIQFKLRGNADIK